MPLFYPYPFYKKCSDVQKSYEEHFKGLSDTQLIDLCIHNSFLEKVHNEMVSHETDNQILSADNQFLSDHLNIYLSGTGRFDEIYASALEQSKDILKDQNPFFHTFFEKKEIKPVELFSISDKLEDISPQNIWEQTRSCLYENQINPETNTPNLRMSALKSLIDGFSFDCISSFNDINLAIYLLSNFVRNIWTSEDFTLVLSACKTNEKFVYLLLWPYFLQPLGQRIWTILLVHFNYFSGSFTNFIGKVSSFLKKGNVLTHNIRNSIRTISVTTTTKVTLGLGSVCGVTLYSIFGGKKQPKIALDLKLYKGFSGFLGSSINLFRTEGSKLVYEITKTLSTFTNAGIAGAIEPKQEVVSLIYKILRKQA